MEVLSCLLTTGFHSLYFSLLPDMSQSWSLFRPLCGTLIYAICSWKFLSLNFREGRHLRYHVGQLIVNFVVPNK